MDEYQKQLPSQLRDKSVIAAADAHRDLAPSLAGPSQPQASSFRQQPPTNAPGGSSLQHEFLSFADGQDGPSQQRLRDTGPNREESKETARIIASSWTAEDLAPRPSDGAEALQFLLSTSSGNSVGNDEAGELNEELGELDARRSQPWQAEADNTIPKDPTFSAPLYHQEDYPYLYELLALPEAQSITTYLNSHSYTDDIWGLPMSLKQDLDRLKDPTTTDQDARGRAVKRLGMLKAHLDQQAKQTAPGSTNKPTFTTEDWDRIWASQEK